MAKEKILVTGGLGYIGSHTVVELINQGYEPIVIDNLSNSTLDVKKRIEKITGQDLRFYQIEMCNYEELHNFVLNQGKIDACIHFAAYLLVDESVEQPLKYYQNNLVSTLNLCRVYKELNQRNIVFSSSCTVYGQPDKLPVSENESIKPAMSPYGNTKKMSEDILLDFAKAYENKVISLRYFNPIGAHSSALIGEFQKGKPHHLVPFITETAIGKRKELLIFGNDWNTRDGSCIRDYIHVVDIALAHINAVQRLIENKSEECFEVFNLGSGEGSTVLEMIKAFEESTGLKINWKFAARRPGDVEAVYADINKAIETLGWRPQHSLQDMMLSAWNWEQSLRVENS